MELSLSLSVPGYPTQTPIALSPSESAVSHLNLLRLQLFAGVFIHCCPRLSYACSGETIETEFPFVSISLCFPVLSSRSVDNAGVTAFVDFAETVRLLSVGGST